MMGFLTALFWIAVVTVCVGLFIGAIICIPTFIYCLPYNIWFGWNAGTKGIPRERSMEQKKFMWRTIKNATKLYRSWCTGKPHGITKF